MPPRILFINRIAPFETTGGCQVIWNLGGQMAEAGWDVHYLAPSSRKPTPQRENTTLHLVEVPGDLYTATYPFYAKATAIARRLIQRLGPELVYDNCIPTPFPQAALWAKSRLVTRIHEVDGLDSFRIKHGVLNPTLTFVGEQWFRFLDPGRIIIDSESGRRRLGRIIRHPERVKIISPGIDLSAIPEPDLSEPREGQTVVSVTRLAKNKGIDYLLRAWAVVERRNQDAELKIAGSGDDEAELKELARTLGLRRARFLGFVSEQDKQRLLSECVAFVFPTLMEGLPINLLEAMANGAPVVSTLVPGPIDLFRNEETGLLVDARTVEPLADAILRLLGDPKLGMRMAVQARSDVEDRDLRKVNAEEMAHLQTLIG